MVLQLFITPEELDTEVRRFATKRDLVPYYPREESEPVPNGQESYIFKNREVVRSFFLTPRAQAKTQMVDRFVPRQRGWIQVAPGLLVDRDGGGQALTLTTIQAENAKDLHFSPTSWLRALKKELTMVTFGVTGNNLAFGGSTDYPNIGYSQLALKLLGDGVHWKYEPTDNLVFLPYG